MKYFFLLAMVFVLSACQLLYVEVIVVNNTDHHVEIKGFYEGVESEVIFIKPYESYVNPQYIDREGGPSVQLFHDYPIDSVNIIFEGVKIIVQSCQESELALCPDVERNILNFELMYELEDDGRNERRYIYTLTEDDYNNAIPFLR